MRGYSPGTVRKMALPVYRTLGVAGRDDAVVLAREVGLLR
jgi:DNA-binding CsgD family transcriptional regulator